MGKMKSSNQKLFNWAKGALVLVCVGGLSFSFTGAAQATQFTDKTQTTLEGQVVAPQSISDSLSFVDPSGADKFELAASSEEQMDSSPFLETVTVENANQQKEFVVKGLDPLVPNYKLKLGIGGKVQVNNQHDIYGLMSDPFAIDANGIPVPSTYTVDDNVLSQVITANSNTVYPVTLAPAIIRNSEDSDTAMVTAYHEYLTEAPKIKLSQPFSKETSSAMQARAVGVGIPGNYVYNTKHARPTLHDYCTTSPDSWFNADFRGSCARHDMCIEGNLGKSKAVQKSLRKGCDRSLLVNLVSSCTVAYGAGIKRNSCNTVASTYYAAVSVKTWTT